MSGHLHDLRCWPEQFECIWDGRKTHELRKDDRPYAVGDSLLLREWDPVKKEYTGRWATVDITYITKNARMWGLEDGFVILSVRLLQKGVGM